MFILPLQWDRGKRNLKNYGIFQNVFFIIFLFILLKFITNGFENKIKQKGKNNFSFKKINFLRN